MHGFIVSLANMDKSGQFNSRVEKRLPKGPKTLGRLFRLPRGTREWNMRFLFIDGKGDEDYSNT